MFDLLIRNGRVVDGTGLPWFRADVGVVGDRVAAVGQPSADELVRMRRRVDEGMEQGAVGLSTGRDYVPSIYADVHELTALCEEITPFDGVYVTHMRGYTPQKFPAAIEEVFAIGRGAGCGVHVSHFNVVADQALPIIDAARAAGVDV